MIHCFTVGFRLEAGDTLMSEASYNDVALVYIISGELTMLQVRGWQRRRIIQKQTQRSSLLVGGWN